MHNLFLNAITKFVFFNKVKETTTEDSSQNKMASTNKIHPDQETKTVSIEMKSIEKECGKNISKLEKDNRGGVSEVSLQDATGEADRKLLIPSAWTAKNQLILLHRKIYLLSFLLVIVFLIAVVSLVLAAVALTAGEESSMGKPTSAPGTFRCVLFGE